MDRKPTALPAAPRDDGHTRIEFCTVSADHQLETALITGGEGQGKNPADDTDANATAQCYAGDFFSPLLLAVRPQSTRER